MMSDNSSTKFYPPVEERVNILSHVFGFIMSVIALVLLVLRAVEYGDAWHIVSFSIFGASLIILFAASSIYHSCRNPVMRRRLRVFDHASIYVLIAGTYTPFTLVTLQGVTGWVIFGVSWGMAVIGIILKLFFTGRYGILSTAMYVFMGWIIVFAISPLIDNLSADGLIWLIAGGVAYTVGAILYGIERLHFNHAIFHVFVLCGAFCHVISVYYYVLPVTSV
jgi:hemolysin III